MSVDFTISGHRPTNPSASVVAGDTGFNLANANARALLALLAFDDSDLFGAASLPEVRRAIIRARARLEREPSPYTRREEVLVGPPRPSSGGTIELHPVRAVIGGLSVAQLQRYLDSLALLVDEGIAQGAGSICWS